MAARFTREDSDRLTRVGPGTPMGEVMRRYWIPACLSEELPTIHCDPIPIDLLGEQLVAFRGADGKVGLVDRFCPHRRASLVLARNEDCSLRCVYHGWKVDGTGSVLETPAEPVNSKFGDSIQAKAYPVEEAGGMVWTYMGPADEQPEFPAWPFVGMPDNHVRTYKISQPCNYLRSIDGELDAAHAGYLHFTKEEWEKQRNTAFDGYKYLFDPRPTTAVEEKPWGLEFIFRYGVEDNSTSAFWIRNFLPPIFAISGQPVGARGLFLAYVPASDHHTNLYFLWWREDAPISDEQMKDIDDSLNVRAGDPAQGYLAREYTPGVGYVQDRAAMDSQESYSGFSGILTQDLAVQHSMGPEIDLEAENLGSEDLIVIKARRYLLRLTEDLSQGKTLPGLHDEMDYDDIQFRWVVAPSDTSWAEISARSDWAAVPGPTPDGWSPAVEAWTPTMADPASRSS